MSDNYEFMKTSEVQDVTDYSPYVDKQYNNYINDINNGVYTNNSLTLINFDLGQIYNSQKFTESSVCDRTPGLRGADRASGGDVRRHRQRSCR